jgi:hypothetical protein
LKSIGGRFQRRPFPHVSAVVGASAEPRHGAVAHDTECFNILRTPSLLASRRNQISRLLLGSRGKR